MRLLTLADTGVAKLSLFQVQQDLTFGDLVRALERFVSQKPQTVHAAFNGAKSLYAAQNRRFIDYLAAGMQVFPHIL